MTRLYIFSIVVSVAILLTGCDRKATSTPDTNETQQSETGFVQDVQRVLAQDEFDVPLEISDTDDRESTFDFLFQN